MDIGKLVEWIKLSPKYLFPLLIFVGFMLFAPTSWLEFFDIVEFVGNYRSYFSVAFLLLSALLGSSCIVMVQSHFISLRIRRRRDRYMRERLHNLAEPEKELLRGFLYNDTRTQYLSMADGIVGGLEVEGILFRSSNVADSIESWAYNIQPWAWEYLKRHPRLLK